MRTAVVLAGGQGARLRPYTAVLPKPLLPVGDRPILEVVISQLAAAGFKRVTVATGYMAELIEVVLSHRKTDQIAIDYAREAEPLGTVGPLATIEDLHSDFLVMNGDVLTDLDYQSLFMDHVASGAIATIATTTRHLQVTLGVLECDDKSDANRLTGYVEKPELTYEVSMGIYCFSPAVLEYIEPGVHLDLPELVLRLIEHRETVRAWRSDAYWMDLGRREDYESAITDFERIHDRLLTGQTNGRHHAVHPAVSSLARDRVSGNLLHAAANGRGGASSQSRLSAVDTSERATRRDRPESIPPSAA